MSSSTTKTTGSPTAAPAADAPVDPKKALDAMIQRIQTESMGKIIEELDGFVNTLNLVLEKKLPDANEETYKHFYTNVLCKAITTILTRAYYFTIDNRLMPAVIRTLRAAVDFILAHPEFQFSQLADALEILLDDTKPFYASNPPSVPTPALYQSDTPEMKVWRENLKVTDWIDAVDDKQRWRPCQIVEITKTDYRVIFDYHESSGRNGDQSKPYPKETVRIAPHWSKAKDFFAPWRRELKAGSQIDSLDTVNKWYTAHVMEVKGDWILVNYDGWSAKYNEWLARTSSRVFEFHSNAITVESGGRESNGIDLEYGSRSLYEDRFDPEGVFTVYRGRDFTSYQLTQTVNYLAERKGFDIILRRLQASPMPPIPIFKKLLDCMSRSLIALARPFYLKLFPGLRAVFDIFPNLPDNDLRNLGKDHLEAITSHMTKFVTRAISSPLEVDSIVENFILTMALKRFKCGNVQRRVEGLASIQDACLRLKKSQGGFLTVAVLNEWLSKNQILESIYNHKDSHFEFMRRSIDIIKFMTENKLFQLKHMDLIWQELENAIRTSNDDILKTIFKVLEEVAYYLEPVHVDYLFDKFKALPMNEVTVGTINSVKEIVRWTHKAPNAAPKALEMLWSVIQDGAASSADIISEARIKFEDIIHTIYTNRTIRVEYINRCLVNLRESRSVTPSLLLVQKLIEQLPDVAISADDVTKASMLAWLTEKQGIVDSVFADFHRFKESARVLAQQRGLKGKKVNEMIVSSHAPFIFHIRDRSNFLNYILTNTAAVLDKKSIDTYWQLAVTESLSGAERETFFKWLRKACGFRNRNFFCFDDETADYIYQNKLMKLDPVTCGKSAYECLERFFFYCNSKANKLEVKGNDDKEAVVLDFFGLNGVDLLWRVALENKRNDVVKLAIACLNRIHERLADAQRAQIGLVRNSYLNHVMTQFKTLSAQKNYSSLERCVTLLTHLLDASEAKGLVGLRPHGAQLRGNPIELNVQYTHNLNTHMTQGSLPTEVHRYVIRVYQNDSLWDLRSLISKRLGMIPDILRIFAAGRPLPPDQNHKTIQELKLRPGESLIVRKQRVEGPRATLLTEDQKSLSPACKAVFTDIFQRFCNKDGFMTKEDFAKYILACGVGADSAETTRIDGIFLDYSDPASGRQRMTLEGFLEFYRFAAKRVDDAIWSDIFVHGYRWDLRKEEDVIREERAQMADEKVQMAEQKVMPRFLLSHTKEFFDLLFQTLNSEEKLAAQVWQLLQRLPTNPDLFQKLYSLDIAAQANPNWDDLLDSKSVYKLLYSLQILESLTGSQHGDSEEEKKKENEERAAWRKNFLLSGGFAHLYSILVSYQKAPAADQSGLNLRKVCVSLLLKTLYNFIISAMAVEKQNLLDVFDRIRLENMEVGKEPEAAPAAPSAPSAPTAPTAPTAPSVYGSYSYDDEAPLPPIAPVSVDGKDSKDGKAEEEKKKKEKEEAERKEREEKEKKEAEERKRRENMPEFRMLVRQMSTNFAGRLLQMVNFTELQSCLLALIELASSGAAQPAAAPAPAPAPAAAAGASAPVSNTDPTATSTASPSSSAATPTTTTPTTTIVKAEAAAPAAAAAAPVVLAPEDVKMVETALNLWVSMLIFNPVDLLPALYKAISADPARILFRPLLHMPSARVRRQFGNAIAQIMQHVSLEAVNNAQAIKPPHTFFLELLLSTIPTNRDNAALNLECDEYFGLVCKLLTDSLGKPNSQPQTFAPLATRLIQQITTYIPHETNNNPDKVDKVLVGMLSILQVLAARDASLRTLISNGGTNENENSASFVKFLFENGLFGEMKQKPAAGAAPAPAARAYDFLFKSKLSRATAFSLLSSLCSSSASNFQELLRLLYIQHETMPKIPNPGYAPEKQMVSQLGYVGLRNMGATCYMNSLIQQFYMIPKFRYGILSAPDNTPAEQRADSLLYQFQSMFGYLSMSEKQFCNTQFFCHSVKDDRGQPINYRVQQDAQEFFGTLVDRLEKRIKDTPQKQLFKSLFAGRLIHQVICQGDCKSIRENSEEYISTSVQVKGKGSLQEALEAFVLGERVSGVNCPTCNKKTDSVRRSLLGSLPNVMIFHLKRFELNFETFELDKLNNRFVFPMDIDLEPYTKEGVLRRALELKAKTQADIVVPARYSVRPEEYYQFQLVGMIIHTGTAQGGHYFSFIKERKPDGTHTNNWIEFNDHDVRPFDINKLEECAYGGEQEVVEKSWSGYTDVRVQDKIKNAYMLFYERNKDYKANKAIQQQQQQKEQQAKLEADPSGALSPKSAGAQPNSPVPAPTPVTPKSNDSKETKGDGKEAKQKAAEAKGDGKEAKDAPTPETGGRPRSNSTDIMLNTLNKMIEDSKQSSSDEVVVGDDLLRRNIRELVPPAIIHDVEQDNLQFLRDRQIFNPAYFKFMSDLIKSANFPEVTEYDLKESANQAMPLIQLAVKFGFETLAKAGDNGVLSEYLANLAGLLEKNLAGSRWLAEYLSKSPQVICDLLLATNNTRIRAAFKDLLVSLFKKLSPCEEKFWLEEEKFTEKVKDKEVSSSRPRSLTVRLMLTLMFLLSEAPKHYMRFGEYFQTMYEFCNLGPQFRKVLVTRKMISLLGDFILGPDSPLVDIKKKPPQMGSRYYPPPWQYLLKTLSLLVRSCATEATEKHGNPPTQLPGEVLPLADTDRRICLCTSLYINHVHQPGNFEPLMEILTHHLYENERFSNVIADLITTAIDRSTDNTVGQLWAVLDAVAGVKDKTQGHRLERLMMPARGVLHVLWVYRDRLPNFTFIALRLLVNTMNTNPAWTAHMVTQRKQYEWIDGWVKAYPNKKYGHIPITAEEKQARQELLDSWNALMAKHNIPLVVPNNAQQQPAPIPLSSVAVRDGHDGDDDDDDTAFSEPGGALPAASGAKRPRVGGNASSSLMVTGQRPRGQFSELDMEEGRTHARNAPASSSSGSQTSADDSNMRQRPRNRPYGPQLPGATVDDISVPDAPQAPEPPALSFGSADEPDWACDACTYVNKGMFASCEMCTTSKPLSAAKPKTQ